MHDTRENLHKSEECVKSLEIEKMQLTQQLEETLKNLADVSRIHTDDTIMTNNGYYTMYVICLGEGKTFVIGVANFQFTNSNIFVRLREERVGRKIRSRKRFNRSIEIGNC